LGKRSFRIYVVDDEKVIAVTIAAILKQSGFDATAFTNPKHALQRAAEEAPDLLLTDVVMPEMSGIDLAIEIKNSCPDCRILLFSGQAATSDMLEVARQRGHVFDILSKPIHPTDLLAAISGVPVPARSGDVS
jgi:CheY-like chemotaxis protein